LAFTNFNEDIDITFPKDYKAHLKMKTNWDDIYSSADLNIQS